MEDTNPEIEADLEALSTICCAAIRGEAAAEIERVDGLLKSLLMSGYTRRENRSLEVDLENRVKSKCGEEASHRGGQLSSLAAEFASKFADLSRQQSLTPKNDSTPKAANISAATDS